MNKFKFSVVFLLSVSAVNASYWGDSERREAEREYAERRNTARKYAENMIIEARRNIRYKEFLEKRFGSYLEALGGYHLSFLKDLDAEFKRIDDLRIQALQRDFEIQSSAPLWAAAPANVSQGVLATPVAPIEPQSQAQRPAAPRRVVVQPVAPAAPSEADRNGYIDTIHSMRSQEEFNQYLKEQIGDVSLNLLEIRKLATLANIDNYFDWRTKRSESVRPQAAAAAPRHGSEVHASEDEDLRVAIEQSRQEAEAQRRIAEQERVALMRQQDEDYRVMQIEDAKRLKAKKEREAHEKELRAQEARDLEARAKIEAVRLAEIAREAEESRPLTKDEMRKARVSRLAPKPVAVATRPVVQRTVPVVTQNPTESRSFFGKIGHWASGKRKTLPGVPAVQPYVPSQPVRQQAWAPTEPVIGFDDDKALRISDTEEEQLRSVWKPVNPIRQGEEEAPFMLESRTSVVQQSGRSRELQKALADEEADIERVIAASIHDEEARSARLNGHERAIGRKFNRASERARIAKLLELARQDLFVRERHAIISSVDDTPSEHDKRELEIQRKLINAEIFALEREMERLNREDANA